MNPAVLSGNTSFLTIFLASFLIWFMFFGLLVIWVIDGRVKREQVLHAVIALLLARIITQVVKELIPTLRPFEINGGLPLTLTEPSDGSFPSGHTSMAFAMAVTIWLHSKKSGLIYIIAALGVGIGRIIANVHFPFDILGGAVIGTLTALFVEKLHVYNLITGRRR